jgi:hypothetical protein
MNRILAIRSWASPMAERIHARQRPDTVETASRILSAGLLVGAALCGGALFARGGVAHAERPAVHADVVTEVKPAKYVKPNSAPAPVSSPRRVWVDPPPLPAVERLQSAAIPDRPAPAPAEPAPGAASVTKTVSSSAPSVPTDCLPAGLRGVLKDVEARFGAVTLVSTTELHTDNHSRGSVRHRLHAACKAIDFKVKGDRKAVVAYLRARPEVAGVNTYGNNGVIHMDYNEPRQVAKR